MGNKLYDINLEDDFFFESDTTSKNRYWDKIKLKGFCTAKEIST